MNDANALRKHPKTLLVIVTEAAIERRLVADALERGAHGWTVSEVRGGGASGPREGDWEADRTVELKVICDPAVADAIAAHVMAVYAPHFRVALTFAEVQVLRPERY
jgi:nitrogen regulatory protein P-II 2